MPQFPEIWYPGAGKGGGGTSPTGPGLPTVIAPITQVEGLPVLAKTRCVNVVQGLLATIPWTILDATGDPIDFSNVPSPSVLLNIREALSFCSNNPGTVVNGTIVNPQAGQVQAVLPMSAVTAPGISVAEYAILSGGTNLIYANWFYLAVEPSQAGAALAGNALQATGVPSFGEIRLYLRDVDPAGNLWMASFEWDAAEISACLTRPVREWNEMLPELPQQYNTSNFPWRHNWLLGTSGYMMRLAADWYRRVHLPYQAGGVTVDDKNKFQIYDARGQELVAQWQDWAKNKKQAINMSEGFATFPSEYATYGNYGFGGPGYW
jgi:hypothetical protein